jgi:hypothetical protein
MTMDAPIITSRDDEFHFDQMSDRWWITETAWFSFCKPEIGLGGWLYSMFRPNIGTVAGGCWVWDDTAFQPWEVPYYANFSATRIPEGQPLTDIALPTGLRMKMVEPLTSYDLEFKDAGRLSVNLRFDAVMPPRPLTKKGGAFKTLSHFDQFGRVHGTITLHGQVIDIDCLSMRDRSWGPRPETRPGKSAYVSGIANPDQCFLVTTQWNEPSGAFASGFQTRDGVTADLVEGVRTVERCPENGWVTQITLTGRDALGRDFHATGRRLSSIIINRHSFIDSNTLIEWDINGHTGHGEDQDMWPVHDWSAFRRAARGARS